jgi:hypothetical protein
MLSQFSPQILNGSPAGIFAGFCLAGNPFPLRVVSPIGEGRIGPLKASIRATTSGVIMLPVNRRRGFPVRENHLTTGEDPHVRARA